MQITRTIDGKTHTFILTDEELQQAAECVSENNLLADAHEHVTNLFNELLETDGMDWFLFGEGWNVRELLQENTIPAPADQLFLESRLQLPLSAILPDGYPAFLSACVAKHEKYFDCNSCENDIWENAVSQCFEEFYSRAVIKYLNTEQKYNPVEIVYINTSVDADADCASYRICYPTVVHLCNDNSHERRIATEQIIKACRLSSVLRYQLVCFDQNGIKRKLFSGKIIGASLNSLCVEIAQYMESK